MNDIAITNAVDILGSAVTTKMYSTLNVVTVVVGLVLGLSLIIWGVRSLDSALDS